MRSPHAVAAVRSLVDAGRAPNDPANVARRPFVKICGVTDADDKRMAAELTEHPKERAEHVMLVDLARNDVGRVVRFGTERVEELMVLERYSHVMHLTSQVAGDVVAHGGAGNAVINPVCYRRPGSLLLLFGGHFFFYIFAQAFFYHRPVAAH